MSIVSSEMRARFSAVIWSSVRILCRRSASLTRRTRTSSEIASNSLRRFSACLAFLVTRSSFLILVRPSTKAPISSPKRSSFSCRVALVSSIVSCRSATAIVDSSRCISVRIAATSSGWEM
ncbi:hypothetical protein D9M72_614210 [compost metagenome]